MQPIAAARRALRRAILGVQPASAADQLEASGRLTMGRHSYQRPAVLDYDEGHFTITIGAFCSIAIGVELMPGGRHPLDAVSTFPFGARLGWGPPEYLPPRDITIGNDVWIGNGVKIMGGVTIGNGAVVAAHSVVTRDVAPYEIVGGAPAAHIRWRIAPGIAERLDAIRWWEWPDDLIAERVQAMADIPAFVELYGHA